MVTNSQIERNVIASPPPKSRPLFTVKDALWLVYLYPLRFFVGCLPAQLVPRLERLMVPLFLLIGSRQRRGVEAKLAPVAQRLPPGRTPREISRAYMRNAVVRALEDLVFERLFRGGHVHCDGIEGLNHLEEALSAGRGAILLSVHSFAGRLAKHQLARSGHSAMSIRSQSPQAGGMGRFGHRVLQPRYVKFLEPVIGDEVYAQSPDCSLQILRRLRAGGVVNVHLDGNTSRTFREVPFLGGTALLPVGFLDIVRLSGTPVLPLLCLGNSRNLRICVGPAFDRVPAENSDEFIDANLPPMARKMEADILAHPDQWELWIKL